MIDDINNGTPESSADEAARRRAEKIAAIRRSVRERTEKPEITPAETAAEKPETKAETAASGDWEDSLSERILKIQKAKNKKAKNILAELDDKAEPENDAPADAYNNSMGEDADPNYEKTVERLAAEILAEVSDSSYAQDSAADAVTAAEESPEQTAEELAAEILAEVSDSSYAQDSAADVSAAAEESPEQTAEELAAEILAETSGDSYVQDSTAGVSAAAEESPEQTAEELAAEILAEASGNSYAQDSVADAVTAADNEAESEEKPVSEPVRAVPAHFREEMPESAAAVEKPKKAVKGSKGKKKKKHKKSFKERFLGLFPQKNDSVGECIRKLVFLGSICVIVVCGYIVSDYYLDLWKSKRINNEVKQIYNSYNDGSSEAATKPADSDDAEPTYIMLDAARKLLDINKDVVGFITIPDTQVGNVVMQSSNNDKYLRTKITGEESRPGEVFLDYRCHFDDMDEEGHRVAPDTNNLIIYGHNMADESMFGCLKYYERNYDYYGQHPIIELNSNYARYKYKIFAFFIVDAEDKSDTAFDCWNQLNFNTEEDFYSFVNEAKRRTLRLNDVDVKYGDSLITLSTCNTLLGENGRLIILARRLRDGEDELEGTQNSTENPNIKWPNLYYEYKSSAKRYDPNAEFVPYGPDSAEKTDETATEAKTDE